MAEQQVVCEGDDLFDFGFEAPNDVLQGQRVPSVSQLHAVEAGEDVILDLSSKHH